MNAPAGERLSTDVDREERVAELRRRIEELEQTREDAFGAFTGWDWAVCTLGGLVLPALALWWFAG